DVLVNGSSISDSGCDLTCLFGLVLSKSKVQPEHFHMVTPWSNCEQLLADLDFPCTTIVLVGDDFGFLIRKSQTGTLETSPNSSDSATKLRKVCLQKEHVVLVEEEAEVKVLKGGSKFTPLTRLDELGQERVNSQTKQFCAFRCPLLDPNVRADPDFRTARDDPMHSVNSELTKHITEFSADTVTPKTIEKELCNFASINLIKSSSYVKLEMLDPLRMMGRRRDFGQESEETVFPTGGDFLTTDDLVNERQEAWSMMIVSSNCTKEMNTNHIRPNCTSALHVLELVEDLVKLEGHEVVLNLSRIQEGVELEVPRIMSSSCEFAGEVFLHVLCELFRRTTLKKFTPPSTSPAFLILQSTVLFPIAREDTCKALILPLLTAFFAETMYTFPGIFAVAGSGFSCSNTNFGGVLVGTGCSRAGACLGNVHDVIFLDNFDIVREGL
ncbi:unnamed protein product, partial [Symbiodinium necroappetens]